METAYDPGAFGRLMALPDGDPADFVARIVAAAREHLDADIGFVAEFDGQHKVIRESSGGIHGCPVDPGTRFDLRDTYCQRLVAGELPSVVHDARNDPLVRDLAITRELDIGLYVGVPVTLGNGRLYGTLCCISHEADPGVHARDVRFMRVLGDLLGGHLSAQEDARSQLSDRRDALGAALRDSLRVVFQPIVSLRDGRIAGMEALARFDTAPVRTPDRWFAEAWALGMGEEAELAAVALALEGRRHLPADVYVSVNVSPRVLEGDALEQLLAAAPAGPVVVEVTEHAIVGEYGPLTRALERCTEAGIRVAVDDFGAGYSGLSHALQVCPSLLKLDVQLTRHIDTDLARQALAVATAGFAAKTGAEIVAEGIETEAEADALRELGIQYGQGFHFGRPQALPHASQR